MEVLFVGLVTTLCGYCFIGLCLVVLHSLATLMKLTRSRRVLGLCYVVVKVSQMSISTEHYQIMLWLQFSPIFYLTWACKMSLVISETDVISVTRSLYTLQSTESEDSEWDGPPTV